MSEPRFGNRRSGKKSSSETELAMTEESVQVPQQEVQELPFQSSTDDILSFMEENHRKKKVIPMRQVIFRLPVDKFEKVERAIGSMSIQQFYSNLTDFYLSKMETSKH